MRVDLEASQVLPVPRSHRNNDNSGRKLGAINQKPVSELPSFAPELG